MNHIDDPLFPLRASHTENNGYKYNQFPIIKKLYSII